LLKEKSFEFRVNTAAHSMTIRLAVANGERLRAIGQVRVKTSETTSTPRLRQRNDDEGWKHDVMVNRVEVEVKKHHYRLLAFIDCSYDVVVHYQNSGFGRVVPTESRLLNRK